MAVEEGPDVVEERPAVVEEGPALVLKNGEVDRRKGEGGQHRSRGIEVEALLLPRTCDLVVHYCWEGRLLKSRTRLVDQASTVGEIWNVICRWKVSVQGRL